MDENIKWEPGNSLIIEIKDKTGDKRTENHIDNMIEKIRPILNEYGFGPCSWGESMNYKKVITKNKLNDLFDTLFEKLF